jgi:GntR family transcriptional regulator
MQMLLPLLVTDDEHVPIYLQLAHQIHYLITSRQLEADAQLPSVRALAEQLGINTGTVAQAYRFLQQEGLIDSKRGKGTFVVPLKDEARQYSMRQALLTDAIDALISRAFSLGFDATVVKQRLGVQLQQSVRTVPMVLVAPTQETAEKYVVVVTQALPDVVLGTIIPCSVEQLETCEPGIVAAYAQAYFTITFASIAPRVEAALRKHGIQSEIIGLTAKLVNSTIMKLRQLGTQSAPVLVAEARNVNSALAIVAQHSEIDLRSTTILTELSGDSEWQSIGDRTVIHTFGVNRLLDDHQIPKGQRLELAFTLSDDACKQLNQLFHTYNTLNS